MCATPLSMALLEWQGSGGFAGAANMYESMLSILALPVAVNMLLEAHTSS